MCSSDLDDEEDPFDKLEEADFQSSASAPNVFPTVDLQPRFWRRGPVVACRSEPLPFLRVLRPQRPLKSIPGNPDTDCNARSFIPLELYQKVCKCIEDGFNAGGDVLDYHSLYVLISYGFRALTGKEFGPSSRHPGDKCTVNATCTGTDDEDDDGGNSPTVAPFLCAYCGKEECLCEEFVKAFLHTTQ